MQREECLGNPDNLKVISLGTPPFQLNPGRLTKAFCLKISQNEVLANESLPFDCSWHSCVYCRTLILEILCSKLEQKENIRTYAEEYYGLCLVLQLTQWLSSTV